MSIIKELFGSSNECRIIDLFIQNPDDEYLFHQVMIRACSPYTTVTAKHITKLLHNDIIIQRPYVEFDENMPIYKLNKDNKMVKLMIVINE